MKLLFKYFILFWVLQASWHGFSYAESYLAPEDQLISENIQSLESESCALFNEIGSLQFSANNSHSGTVTEKVEVVENENQEEELTSGEGPESPVHYFTTVYGQTALFHSFGYDRRDVLHFKNLEQTRSLKRYIVYRVLII